MKTIEELGISPAPWYRKPYDGGAIPDVVTSADGGVVLNRMAYCDDRDKTLIANARLIAAAPTMYDELYKEHEFLVDLYKNQETNFHWRECIQNRIVFIKAALEKACGEEAAK